MRKATAYVPAAILLLAIGFAAGVSLHAPAPRREALPILGQVPDYVLTNQLGQATSSASFHGKVRVVTFLFTYCREYCPLIAHNFLTLERILEDAGLADQVQLVAFNVDPGETGPAQMEAFQRQYGWDPADLRWQFLTGSPDEIHRIVVGAYHVSYQKVGAGVGDGQAGGASGEGDSVPEPVVQNKLADAAGVDYDIVHNDVMVVVDTEGRIRKVFGQADRVPDERILDVIEQLLPASEKGATRPAAGGNPS